ncbi:MAG: SH3 domain-containing protein [Clostridia bacterium]|nr:SH3 domain-containing protein [Clostridia bacterium]
MKKLYRLLLALAVVLLMLSTTALAESLRFGTVDGASTVNLRSGASTGSYRLGSYKEGTWLRITGEYGDFYKVTAPDGKTGFMVKDYVYMSAAAKGVVGIVDVNGDLNMRASGSYSARVTGTYPDGTPCILLTENGDWYHVTVDGKLGYFNADYVDKKYMTYSSDVATIVTANGGMLNMRKGPGSEYGVVKSFRNGSFVMVIQQGRDWWKVAADGYVGFMDADFLQDGIVRNAGASTGGSSSGGSTGDAGGNSYGDGYAVVNNPGANQKLFLRKAASKSSKALGQFGNGTYVTVLEQGNTWCKVQVNGITGYMMTEFLKFYGMSASATARVDHPDGTFVYLRGGPSQSTGKVLMKVPHGARVTILTPGSTWSQVKYNGTTGYMMTRFLDK